MSTWIFEPGHTEAEFRARHMMVTWVRGLFKDVHGQLELDWDHRLDATFEGEIDAAGIWTGEPRATPTYATPTSSTSRTTPRSPSAAASPSAPPRPHSRARSSSRSAA